MYSFLNFTALSEENRTKIIYPWHRDKKRRTVLDNPILSWIDHDNTSRRIWTFLLYSNEYVILKYIARISCSWTKLTRQRLASVSLILSIASSQSSVILIKIDSVQWCGRNPDCVQAMRLNERRYSINRVHMCLSDSFEIIGRAEMGRKSFGSEAGPDLWTGVTRASLRAEGQTSDWMLQFRTLVRLSRIAGEIGFSRGALIPSRLVPTFVGSDLFNSSNVLVSRRGISKFEVEGFLVLKKFSNCFRSGLTNWFLSIIYETMETKCLLDLFA